MDTNELLRIRREELGLSRKDVAEAIGVAGTTIMRWETGEISNMRIDHANKLAKVLHLSPLDIVSVGESIIDEQDELEELLETLRSRDDMRMLFKLAKDATPEDVRQAVKIIEALRGE